MATPNPNYVDGYFLPDRETSVRPVVQYPFANQPTPDKFSTIWGRSYYVVPALYSPRIANRTSWTNLLTYSEAFDNAAWTKNATTIAADSVIAPDGATSMDSVLETATTAEHSVSRALTLTAASSSLSVFVASLSRDWIRIKFVDFAAAVFTCFFNVTSGYVGAASTGVTGSVVPLPGGRFRCIATFTPAAGAGTLTINASTDGATVSYAGDITKGVYLWGAQAVTASSAGPYIGTTGTTRAVSSPDQERTINANAAAQDPLAYLVDESDPNLSTSTLAIVQRKFARIPQQQVSFSTIALTKPSPSGVGVADANFRDNLSNFLSPGYAYSSYYFGNNEVYGPTASTSSTNSGSNTRVTWTSHGLAGTEKIGARGSSFFLFTTGQYTVVDANTVDLLNVNFGSAIGNMAKKLREYTPGAARIGTQLTDNFYLPGVSSGISTTSDIPIPSPLINDTLFINAIIANLTGYVTYDANPLGVWLGPIYVQRLIAINMANV